jgi:hypothetical protein
VKTAEEEKEEVSKKYRGANLKESLLREDRRKKSARRVGERTLRSRSYVKSEDISEQEE